MASRFSVDGSGSGSCKIAEFAVSGSNSSYPIDNASSLRWVNLRQEQFVVCALLTWDVLGFCSWSTSVFLNLCETAAR